MKSPFNSINHLLWDGRNPTLSEYLGKIGSKVKSNVPQVGFPMSRATLFRENVNFISKRPRVSNHFSIAWMQNLHVGRENLVIIACESSDEERWIGVWNPESKKYDLSPSTAYFGFTFQQSETEFSVDEHRKNTFMRGPICVHPETKFPMVYYHAKEADESTRNLTLIAALWNAGQKKWQTCTDQEQIIIHLPPKKPVHIKSPAPAT